MTYPDWLRDAYIAIFERQEPINLEEARRLGLEEVVKISKARHELRAIPALFAFTRSELDEMAGQLLGNVPVVQGDGGISQGQGLEPDEVADVSDEEGCPCPATPLEPPRSPSSHRPSTPTHVELSRSPEPTRLSGPLFSLAPSARSPVVRSPNPPFANLLPPSQSSPRIIEPEAAPPRGEVFRGRGAPIRGRGRGGMKRSPTHL
ncbi:hypothetical protein JAAARDRAFT_715484 [Jaapia argillacea MUCL 33604]|uniref:Uncharacterized protein n=1 Tax=Jaapia argillacea MUCL 33604 TaxID=933084 RepID=A0A067PWN1_9AGAM|nr:hypothetical protein JAAARDRAFT_715484 [Jaapia argillacea MUCL 33604]